MAAFEGFPADTIRFLQDLNKNNNREWFADNKQRYEASFLMPALEFIEAMVKPLEKTAPMLRVESKKVGGSLMRIYRDTRFAKDKTPYKTNIGIQFRHRAGKDVHAPGIYLHIAPEECFLGAGIWRPASDALTPIRHFIAENEQAWRKVQRSKSFNGQFEIYDDRLKSVPRGFAKDHPLIETLRLKSFLGMAKLARKQVQSKELPKTVTSLVRSSRPLMELLCTALNQPY